MLSDEDRTMQNVSLSCIRSSRKNCSVQTDGSCASPATVYACPCCGLPFSCTCWSLIGTLPRKQLHVLVSYKQKMQQPATETRTFNSSESFCQPARPEPPQAKKSLYGPNLRLVACTLVHHSISTISANSSERCLLRKGRRLCSSAAGWQHCRGRNLQTTSAEDGACSETPGCNELLLMPLPMWHQLTSKFFQMRQVLTRLFCHW